MASASYTYIRVNDPSATWPFGINTSPTAINNEGQIIGEYVDGNGVRQNFLDTNGNFSLLPVPAWPSVESAYVFGINDLGQVVGHYNDWSGLRHAFIESNGNLTELNDPLSLSTAYGGTWPGQYTTFVTGINDAGEVVGYYRNEITHITSGFLHTGTDPSTGYSTIYDKLAYNYSVANGINQSGEIVGTFNDSSGDLHGFLFNNGTYTTIDYGTNTTLVGINDLGQIVGDSSLGTFIYSNGVFTPVTGLPGLPTGINDKGQIIGSYVSGNAQYGFLATPTDSPPVIDMSHSTLAGTVNELPNTTGSNATDQAVNSTGMPGGFIAFSDPDMGDRPAASIDTTHESLVYHGSNGQTYSLTPSQIAVIESGLSITPAASNTNSGYINWTYHVTDSLLDFLGAGESLTFEAPVTIDDHNGGAVTADITITIKGANDNPVANPVAANVENSFTALSNAAGGVLSHDRDPDIHDVLYISAVHGSGANVGRSIAGRYGTLTLNADGSYSYTENFLGRLLSLINFSAVDTFSYTVSDGHGGTASSTLTFNTREAARPVAAPDAATVAQGGTVAQPASSGVLANDKDPDGDALTVSSVSFRNQQVAITASRPAVINGLCGTLTLGADGSYSYTETSSSVPARGAQDVFTYSVSDGHGGMASSNLAITVIPLASITPTYAAKDSILPATDFYDHKGGNLIAENIGGSLSWRNNNPGNITLGVENGLAIGTYAANGLTYEIFPDYNTGVLAAVQLLEGSLYAGVGLSIDQAMQKWTNLPANSPALKHYDLIVDGALGLPESTLIKNLSPTQLDTVVTHGIQVAEGWTVGHHLTFGAA
jgi:probable HAF family extracellular repeat protein/VCBS repeat-containing protein